jgi:MFS family permease
MAASAQRRDGSTAYVVLLTLVAALGGLLFGYDTAVISGAIGFLQEHFRLDPRFETGWATACALLGCALGAGLAGLLSDRFGRKRMLVAAAVLFLVSSVGTAFPPDFFWFVVFRLVAGLAVGAASITSPMYIAEVSPAGIRGRMVSVNQFAIVTGFILVYFVNYFIAVYGSQWADRDRIAATPALAADAQLTAVRSFVADKLRGSEKAGPEAVDAFPAARGGAATDEEIVAFLDKNSATATAADVQLARRGLAPWNVTRGWRWMFASGILPSAVFLLSLLLVPESPRWLVKRRREDEAVEILARVGGSAQAQWELSEIQAAVAQETGSVLQLFMPGMRVALVIGVLLAILQQITGVNVLMYYAPEIFKRLGYETSAALLATVWLGVVDLLFTIVAIWTVDWLGRKPLMILGSAGMGLCLAAMGLAYCGGQAGSWMLAFVLAYKACFAISVGPVTWVILSEIFPTGIRGRAMAIATVCLWVANYVVIQTFPMIRDARWIAEPLSRAAPFWIYAFFCAVSVAFLWRFVPETKGKTLEEIERGWLSGRG